MSELRRLKMKFGNAEFEAEVAEDKVQPMYDQFLSILGHAGRTPKHAGSIEYPVRHSIRACSRGFSICMKMERSC